MENRSYEFLDAGAAVLIVGVGIDDDIRPSSEGGVQTGGKGAGQALIDRRADDLGHAVPPGHLRGLVGAPSVLVRGLELRRDRGS